MEILIVVASLTMVALVSWRAGYNSGFNKPVDIKVDHTTGYNGYQAYPGDGESTIIYRNGERASFDTLTIDQLDNKIIVTAEGVKEINFNA